MSFFSPTKPGVPTQPREVKTNRTLIVGTFHATVRTMAQPAKPNIQLVEQQALLARRNFEKALKANQEGNCQAARTLYLSTKILARKTTEDFITIGGKIPRALGNMFTVQALADMIIERSCPSSRSKVH